MDNNDDVLDPTDTADRVNSFLYNHHTYPGRETARLGDMIEAGLRVLTLSSTIEFIREYNSMMKIVADDHLTDALRHAGMVK